MRSRPASFRAPMGNAQRWFATLLLAWLGAFCQARADGAPSADLQVDLVTVGPGQIYWERFGHNALWIRDRVTGADRFYHYGVFDFSERDFMLNFARGRMMYRMVRSDAALELGYYRAQGRSIMLQTLRLTPAQSVRLANFLANNALPQNARYRYDYFRSNCSTKIRDAIDAALDGQLSAATRGRSRGATWRDHALRLTAPDPLLYLGIHAGLGPASDQPIDFWSEGYVPMELARQLQDLVLRTEDGHTAPAVTHTRMLATARYPAPPQAPPDWRLRFLLAGLLLAGLIVWQPKMPVWAQRPVGLLIPLLWLVAGLGGCVLLALWWGTEHQAAWRNVNALLFHPACLGLVPTGVRLWLRRDHRPSRFAVALSALVAASAVLAWVLHNIPGWRQDMIDWFLLWAPIHGACLHWLKRKSHFSA